MNARRPDPQGQQALLCNQGEIFSSSGIIYLQPDYVTRLLKPLVDHRLSSASCAVEQR